MIRCWISLKIPIRCWLWNGIINICMHPNVYGVFHMSNVFFGDVWCIMLLTNKLGHSLHHTFAIGTCMCLIIDGDLVIPFKICLNERYFHLWLHSYNEGPPRLNISFMLWHYFFLPSWWFRVLSWVVRRGLTINPYEMGDDLQHDFYRTSCICCKWWKNMAHCGEVYSLIKGCVLVTEGTFAHAIRLVKIECKHKCLTPLNFVIQCNWM
jgi:hypothetical protein